MNEQPRNNDSAEPEIVATDQGPVTVASFSGPEQIHRYRFDRQFGSHAQYKSIYTKRQTLEKIAAKPDTRVVLALSPQDTIIGFGVLDFPEPHERWYQLGPGLMIELKAIEVSRSWRANKLASRIVGHLMRHPRIEHMIAYLVGYSWTWDLDGTGFSAQQYRRMLIDLFTPHGFSEYQTNEPNICLRPENLFMGRIGNRVPEDVQQQFKWLRFGITPG